MPFYVRINSELSIDEKRRGGPTRHVTGSSRLKAANPGFEDWQVRLHILLENMAQVAPYGRWQDKWVSHPFPNMSEPAKANVLLDGYPRGTIRRTIKRGFTTRRACMPWTVLHDGRGGRIRLLERPGV